MIHWNAQPEGNKLKHMRYIVAELSKKKTFSLSLHFTSEPTVPLKSKLPPSLYLETRLVSFETFLVSRECTVSSNGFHGSDAQSQCSNTMM